MQDNRVKIEIETNGNKFKGEFEVYGNHFQDIEDGYLIDFISCFSLSDVLNGLTSKDSGQWFHQDRSYSVKDVGTFKHWPSGETVSVSAKII